MVSPYWLPIVPSFSGLSKGFQTVPAGIFAKACICLEQNTVKGASPFNTLHQTRTALTAANQVVESKSVATKIYNVSIHFGTELVFGAKDESNEYQIATVVARLFFYH